ncbi:hypothetical protein EVAR_45247_1 [Eumeta japonica]|uniref:Uncharacterized protein n=1 Tax=Eumeta variegata TaxID=151549 RepID=A0A4C1XCR4_EUMVA|nr:hypothetical protein EVAR_45247_1 [Eumeta japonica]
MIKSMTGSLIKLNIERSVSYVPRAAHRRRPADQSRTLINTRWARGMYENRTGLVWYKAAVLPQIWASKTESPAVGGTKRVKVVSFERRGRAAAP